MTDRREGKLESAASMGGHTPIVPAPAYSGWESRQQPPKAKRHRISSACTSCQRRKSKCNGELPSCGNCLTYATQCTYDLETDLRKKQNWHRETERLRTENTMLKSIVDAYRNADGPKLEEIARFARTTESLEEVALYVGSQQADGVSSSSRASSLPSSSKSPAVAVASAGRTTMSIRNVVDVPVLQVPASPWTPVISDPELVSHLIQLYLTWELGFFYWIYKDRFLTDMISGDLTSEFCSPLLVNSMLSVSCAYSDREEVETEMLAIRFFEEAKRLWALESGKPRMTSMQALAIMGNFEAYQNRDVTGRLYTNTCFQMYFDLGCHHNRDDGIDEDSIARRVVAWGMFCFEKVWFLGYLRPPRLPQSTLPPPPVVDNVEDKAWFPYPDLHNPMPELTHTRFKVLCSLCKILGWDMSASDAYQRLIEWHAALLPSLDPRINRHPANLQLHLYYHSTILCLPSAARDRDVCVRSAVEISVILRTIRMAYPLRRTTKIVMSAATVACLVHLFNLSEEASRDGLIDGLKTLRDIGKVRLAADVMLRIVMRTALVCKVERLPEQVIDLFRSTDSTVPDLSLSSVFNDFELPAPENLQFVTVGEILKDWSSELQ